MAKRKKKNAITLFSLLLALVALIVVYIWYSNRDNTEDTTEDKKETISLANVDAKLINSLHYKYDTTDLTLIFEDEMWKSKVDPYRPINQDYVNRMLDLVTKINATRMIEDPDNLADYGLDHPTSYLQAVQTDGTTVTLQIGSELNDGDGYYALVNEDNKVYVVGSTYGSGLVYNDLDLTAMEEAPQITAESIHHIDIMKRDGDDFELVYDKDNKLDYSGNDMFSWVILKPYEEGFTADGNAVTTLEANYTNFSFVNCVDYRGADLSMYGLDDPMASIYVGYYGTEQSSAEGMEIKLYVGNLNENGRYYVKKEGSDAVYTMEAATVDTMLSVNPFSIVNPYVCIPNINSIDKIDINIAGEKHTMEITRKATGKKVDGKDELATTYFHDGKEVAEDIFKDIYQIIITAKYDAELKDVTPVEESEAYMTLTFHLNSGEMKEITTSYLLYDDSFYMVKTDNATRFFADKRKVEKIANAILEFKSLETQE